MAPALLPIIQKAGHKPLPVFGILIRASREPYLNANRPCVSMRADVKEFPI